MIEENKVIPAGRPGCISVFAVLLIIYGGIGILGTLLISLGVSTESMGSAAILFFCLGLFSFYPIITGIGLWQMKKWGWVLVMIYFAVALIFFFIVLLLNILATISNESGGDGLIYLLFTLIPGVIYLAILNWFIKNRHLFNGRTKQVITPEGEVIHEPVSGSGSNTAVTVSIVGGIAAVVCLIPIVVIAILTLLGPQIANVFSRITDGLG